MMDSHVCAALLHPPNSPSPSPILWSELNLQSKAPQGQALEVTSHGQVSFPYAL